MKHEGMVKTIPFSVYDCDTAKHGEIVIYMKKISKKVSEYSGR